MGDLTNLFFKEYSHFKTAREIIVGRNSVDQIGSILKVRGVAKVGIVTEEGILRAGISGKLEKILKKSGIGFEVFPDVIPEPPIKSIKWLADKVKRRRL